MHARERPGSSVRRRGQQKSTSTGATMASDISSASVREATQEFLALVLGSLFGKAALHFGHVLLERAKPVDRTAEGTDTDGL